MDIVIPLKPNQKNEIKDITIRMIGLSRTSNQKNGLFIKKHKSFSLSEIDSAFYDLTKRISLAEEIKK